MLKAAQIATPANASAAVVAPRSELENVLAVPYVQAAFIPPAPRAAWQDELDAAVEAGEFRVPRTELAGIGIDIIATWLDGNLPQRSISRATRDALLSDLIDLMHLQAAITNTATLRVRILTAAPDRRCGFHVDTVLPGLPTWGLFRVYNGVGTNWIDASAVESMQAFYAWLHDRDRIVRRFAHDAAERDARLEILDCHPEFLVDSASIEYIAAGTTVVFRHLDACYHWQDHSPQLAWIHCSPMAGEPRLVVNVSASHPGVQLNS
ncbi:MAG: DUF1826 domain-containing protein [Woeseiaceae bacterium]